MAVVAVVAPAEAAPEWDLARSAAAKPGFFLCLASDVNLFAGDWHNTSDGFSSFTAVRRILHHEIRSLTGKAVLIGTMVNCWAFIPESRDRRG